MAEYDPIGGRFIPIGGGRYPDGSTVYGGQPYSYGRFNPGGPAGAGQGGGNGGGVAAMLNPTGSWSSSTVNTHPFQGLQDLLQSSILSRLMDQRGVAGSEVRGLQGGGVAWNHLEDPYGRLSVTTDTFKRAPAAVLPPRNRGGIGGQIGSVFSKVLDENGYPVEAFPGPFHKIGLNADGSPTQYRNAQGGNIPNPYL